MIQIHPLVSNCLQVVSSTGSSAKVCSPLYIILSIIGGFPIQIGFINLAVFTKFEIYMPSLISFSDFVIFSPALKKRV